MAASHGQTPRLSPAHVRNLWGLPYLIHPKLCQDESSKDGHELWFHIVVIFGAEVGCAPGTLPSLAGSICDLVLL